LCVVAAATFQIGEGGKEHAPDERREGAERRAADERKVPA
jgi:hypothetical protein